MAYEREKQIAIEAVTLASQLCSAVRTEIVGVASLAKDDKSPVTIADFGSQALVCHHVRAGFPRDPIVGEEDSTDLQKPENASTLAQVVRYVRRFQPDATAESVCHWIDAGNGQVGTRFWALDPIDGTKGFLRRDQYAVALGKIERGVVTIGVLGCPDLVASSEPAPNGAGSLVVAVRGEGTWWQPLVGNGRWQQLRVSDRTEPANARILHSVEKAHTNTDEIGSLAAHLGIAAPQVPLDSQAKYAVLAAGAGDVLLRLISPKRPDYKEKIWDQAAGSLVITEAGGRITDLDGKPLDFAHGRSLEKNRGILATNGPLHEPLLAGLRAIGA